MKSHSPLAGLTCDFSSERKKHERPQLLIPPPESPEGTDALSVEPLASSVESVSAVESATQTEPATGNEQRTDGQHDPTLETGDTANRIDDDESPDKTKTA